ncbi:hypothetical protein [Desertibacillus haloalkaliphilus]|uniref:hypothetical protein n=1 Tax=Desertibacillus haloalkaliphilus TaxID=1328930 RepID=UPI001C26843B|nr:hypothetical protein [Desertibacillus haloalkaliphilus]MBU8906840.1 hypothetical protein [Desertibacillus haloalkaliphilus]
MYNYQHEYDFNFRQQPSLQFLPPTVIERYMNQWITTTIPGYGQVVAYVLDYNHRTGMVSLFIYPRPSYQQQFIQVHHSDLVGISPYFGPTPPRPPWQPVWPGHGGGPWGPPRPPTPGPGHGGGFWPWVWHQFVGGLGGPQR